MIEITCNLETGKLNLTIKNSKDFQETVENLKNSKCLWNPKDKVWEKSIFDFDDLVGDLEYFDETVEYSELVKTQIQQFKDNLSELRQFGRKYPVNWDLMRFKPIQGKHPFESYQRDDIICALAQNRYLFNWEMGLGKSFALATLIENLRAAGRINKCLIFSTRVGIYNLKDELIKFGKTFKAEDIFVLNSITEKDFEDRDIFNIEKYPYNTIILTYDTFKSVNNYYYDKANMPKTAYKKIEAKEAEIREEVLRLREEYKSKGIKSDEYNKLIDKDTKKLQQELSVLKEKLHPSNKATNYRSSYIPMLEWMEGHHAGLFLDEVHVLGNPSSRRSELLLMNTDYFYYRYEFTGTLADKYEKLYLPLRILDRALVEGKSYTDWLNSYCEVGNRWSRYAVNDNSWNMEKLSNLNKELLRTYGSKRKMNECLDLPLDYEVPTIWLDMDAAQRSIYEAFVKEELKVAKDRKLSGEATVKDSILNMFGIFQLAVDNPECIKKSDSFSKLPKELQDQIKNYSYAKCSNKLTAVKDVIYDRTDEDGERGIIWYYHPVTKDVLVKELKKYDPIVVESGMTPDEISAAIKEFKSNPKHKIIIGSINIMNTSVTLIECTYQVYLEKTYNYTVYSQSRGRIHRPNKTAVSKTYDLCYKNSIDYLQKENLDTKGMTLNTLMNKNYIDQQMWQRIFSANSPIC